MIILVFTLYQIFWVMKVLSVAQIGRLTSYPFSYQNGTVVIAMLNII